MNVLVDGSVRPGLSTREPHDEPIVNAIAVAGIGICGPGVADWAQARAVLHGGEPFVPQPLAKLAAMSLPATERRRANSTAHLALRVADEAIRALDRTAAAKLQTVLSSAHGDGQVLAQMLAGLAQPNVALSPTIFHNSVFNAPSGYWTIALRSQAPSTTVCAGHASFAAGLLEALTQVRASGAPVLYIALDLEFPASLDAFSLKFPTFACALLLAPAPVASNARPYGTLHGWNISSSPAGAYGTPDPSGISPDRPDENKHEHALLAYFAANPSAQALALICPIARAQVQCIRLPYLDRADLDFTYTP